MSVPYRVDEDDTCHCPVCENYQARYAYHVDSAAALRLLRRHLTADQWHSFTAARAFSVPTRDGGKYAVYADHMSYNIHYFPPGQVNRAYRLCALPCESSNIFSALLGQLLYLRHSPVEFYAQANKQS